MRKNIKAAASPEALAKEADAGLTKMVSDTVSTLKAIENGSPYNPAAFRAGLQGKLKRMADRGEIDEVRKALKMVQEMQESQGLKKPVFAKNNAIWKYADAAETKLASKPTGKQQIAEYKGAKVENDFEAERIKNTI